MRAFFLFVAACSGSAPAAVGDAAVAGDVAAAADATASPGDAAADSAGPVHYLAYVGGSDIAWLDVGDDGTLTPLGHADPFAPTPSFLALAPTALYAVSETNSRIDAYSRDPSTGAVTFLNDVASGGSGPAYVSRDRSGAWVLAANYGDGSVAVFPVQSDGSIGDATQTVAAGQNAHMILTDPSNHHVFVPCLGSSYVAQYDFDVATGMLTPNAVPHFATAAGAGPRHLAFSPDGMHAYLIDETASTLMALAYDPSSGQLSTIDTISTRPPGATGTNTAAEIWVHPNGHFVYGSNRGDNTIAVFAVDDTGDVSLIGQTATQGMTPRMFSLDPTGRFLYAANQDSSTVVAFAIDSTTGALTPIGSPISAPAPEFVELIAQTP